MNCFCNLREESFQTNHHVCLILKVGADRPQASDHAIKCDAVVGVCSLLLVWPSVLESGMTPLIQNRPRPATAAGLDPDSTARCCAIRCTASSAPNWSRAGLIEKHVLYVITL